MFILWIAFGILAGATAQSVFPGRAPGGIGATILIGILAALVGGTAATLLGLGTEGQLDVPALAVAVMAVIVALFGFRLYVDRAKY